MWEWVVLCALIVAVILVIAIAIVCFLRMRVHQQARTAGDFWDDTPGRAGSRDQAVEADDVRVSFCSSEGNKSKPSRDLSYSQPTLSELKSPPAIAFITADETFASDSHYNADEISWTGRYAPRFSQYLTAEFGSRQHTPTPPPVASMLPLQSQQYQGKYTIVLDMDETLLHSKEYPPYRIGVTQDIVMLKFPNCAEVLYSIIRPHAREFLRTIGPLCEVVLWTAGEADYASTVMENLDDQRNIDHFIFRDSRWFTLPSYVKALETLGRDMTRTLLIDNTDFVCAADPNNSIVISDFVGGAADTLLVTLENLIVQMVLSDRPVPEFLEECRRRGQLHYWGGLYRLTGLVQPHPTPSMAKL
eukprot:NODE_2754_length_1349_cov_126.795269_g2616_i0.p1 GENE.NODE_2754_length_1349_cov_126.795269_g2616_i0~~NODE_2754_length_1349_cov_126.795269_g2616_i0.p1  ORF type:complete len:360 (+),score=37.54 NODE_2754_length_1349_cov_126.795269_g2616_i0:78-1157(+)